MAKRFSPTKEQVAACDAFATESNLKINAFAGSGKTSTLELLSNSTGRTGIYLAFNKSIVADAQKRFGRNTRCSTIHSLAWRSTPKDLTSQHYKMTKQLNAKALVEIFKLEDLLFEQKIRVTATTQAYLIQKTVRSFLQSEDSQIEPIKLENYGRLALLDGRSKKALSSLVDSHANAMWEAMIDASNRTIPLGHDGYVKLWSLSNPEICADFILLDEAQDTNPVALAVLKHQNSQIVYVGDRHQQIYAWRGAVNAMEMMEAEQETYLTKSFRFGPVIAHLASQILRHLGETRVIEGNAEIGSSIEECEPNAVLARTNIGVMTEVIASINRERSCYVLGDTYELKALLRGVVDLKNGKPSSVPDFFGFMNWDEVVELVSEGEGDQLEPLVNLVKAHGERHLLWALNRTERKEEDAEVVVSTAHKAKGREWDRVRLADDFSVCLMDDATGRRSMESDEARLLYVAATRARVRLSVPGAILSAFASGVSVPQRLVQRCTEMGKSASSSRPTSSATKERKPISRESKGRIGARGPDKLPQRKATKKTKRSAEMDSVLDELDFLSGVEAKKRK